MKKKDYFIQSMGEGWYDLLKDFLLSPEMDKIGRKVFNSRKIVYPKKEDMFRAFKLCPIEKTKVIILGQDPYHDTNRATGLAFSNSENSLTISPSLKHIWKELESDYDTVIPAFDTTLENWAEQGVLLINTALSVEKSNAGSHSEIWKPFTDYVLRKIISYDVGYVFILWGNHAKSYIPLLKEEDYNFILSSAHPSPFSANKGFFGSKPFSKTNEVLKEIARGKELDPDKHQIKWY